MGRKRALEQEIIYPALELMKLECLQEIRLMVDHELNLVDCIVNNCYTYLLSVNSSETHRYPIPMPYSTMITKMIINLLKQFNACTYFCCMNSVLEQALSVNSPWTHYLLWALNSPSN